MMTLFNEFNARKIDGSTNVFSGLHRSHMFIIIWTLSFILQVIIIQFGTVAFFTVPLTVEQWFWCLLFGIAELLYGQIVAAVHYIISAAVQKWGKHDQHESHDGGYFDNPIVFEMSTSDDEKLIAKKKSRHHASLAARDSAL
jgi:Ca2+ transporting ATPase